MEDCGFNRTISAAARGLWESAGPCYKFCTIDSNDTFVIPEPERGHSFPQSRRGGMNSSAGNSSSNTGATSPSPIGWERAGVRVLLRGSHSSSSFPLFASVKNPCSIRG